MDLTTTIWIGIIFLCVFVVTAGMYLLAAFLLSKAVNKKKVVTSEYLSNVVAGAIGGICVWAAIDLQNSKFSIINYMLTTGLIALFICASAYFVQKHHPKKR